MWPWARDLLGDAKPTVLTNTDGFQFEKIAALQPDLIIGTNAGVTQADYDKLSKLAPTVTNPKGSEQYFSPWDEQTVQIAKAVGQEAKGAELVAQTKAAYAKVKADYPQVFATESQQNFDELQKWSTIKNLDAVREGRAVYTDTILAGAIYFMTPLSLDYVLVELTPLLEAAAEGEAPQSYPS